MPISRRSGAIYAISRAAATLLLLLAPPSVTSGGLQTSSFRWPEQQLHKRTKSVGPHRQRPPLLIRRLPAPRPHPQLVPSPAAPPLSTPPPFHPPGAVNYQPRGNDGKCLNGKEATLVQYLGSVRSTYHFYHPDYNVSTVYCADSFADKARAWELEFPWVAYCAPFLGGMTQDKCGKLLRMTNASGGMRLIVRVVDSCGNNGMDLDQQSAFNPLDTDGSGYLQGYMNLTLELVEC
ncbi:Pathogenesis-related protein PR-4B [Chlorella vulgaris]